MFVGESVSSGKFSVTRYQPIGLMQVIIIFHLLPPLVFPCPSVYIIMSLLSPDSAHDNITMEYPWTMTFTLSYCFVLYVSIYSHILYWILLTCYLFFVLAPDLLPLSVHTCPLLHSSVLVSADSVHDIFTVE